MASTPTVGEVRDFTIPDGQGGTVLLHGVVQAADANTVTLQSTTGSVTLTVPTSAVGEVSGPGWYALAAQVEAERNGG